MQLSDVETAQQNQTVIFTKNNCTQCELMKRRLNSLEIPYVEYNLENHPELIPDLKALGARSAPIVKTPKGQYLFGNTLQIENQLMHELKTAHTNHLYTAHEQAELNYEFPALTTDYDLVNGWGKQIGVLIQDNEKITSYYYEVKDENSVIVSNEHAMQSKGRFTTVDTPVSFPTKDVETRVIEIYSTYFRDDIKDNLINLRDHVDIPLIEQPREILFNAQGWHPTNPIPPSLKDVFTPTSVTAATYYTHIDFQTALAEPGLKQLIKDELRLTDEQLSDLKTIKNPPTPRTHSADILQTHAHTRPTTHNVQAHTAPMPPVTNTAYVPTIERKL